MLVVSLCRSREDTHAKAIVATKSRWLRHPMQLLTQEQWWSKPATQLPQRRQWCDPGGRWMRHALQYSESLSRSTTSPAVPLSNVLGERTLSGAPTAGDRGRMPGSRHEVRTYAIRKRMRKIALTVRMAVVPLDDAGVVHHSTVKRWQPPQVSCSLNEHPLARNSRASHAERDKRSPYTPATNGLSADDPYDNRIKCCAIQVSLDLVLRRGLF